MMARYVPIRTAMQEDLLSHFVNMDRLYDLIDAIDPQTEALLFQVIDRLREDLTVPESTARALSRVRMALDSIATGEANLRNIIFKAANELGLDLPSHFF